MVKQLRNLLVIGGALILVIAVSALGIQRMSVADSQRHPIDFTLQDINGRQVRLSDYRGKVVVVDVWATWCGHCVGEIPNLMTLQSEAEQEKLPLQFLGIAMDDNAVAVRNFAVQRGVNYPVLYKDASQMQPFGEIDGLPTKFIIDRNGAIVDTLIGAQTTETISRHVARYLK